MREKKWKEFPYLNINLEWKDINFTLDGNLIILY